MKEIFLEKKIVKEKQSSQKIEISSQKLKRKIKKSEEIFSEFKPPAYVENIMERLIKSNNSLDLDKSTIFFEGTKETLLFDARDKKLKKSPAYMKYHRAIREKLRARAYQYRNYFGRRQGQVVVRFLVAPDGALGKINFTAESSKDKTLQEITLKVVRESAPFAAFPEEFKKYPYLWFKIPIDFETN